jgi:hypothetical protein
MIEDIGVSGIATRQAIIDNSRKKYAIKYKPKEKKVVESKRTPAKPRRSVAKKIASSSRRKLPGQE